MDAQIEFVDAQIKFWNQERDKARQVAHRAEYMMLGFQDVRRRLTGLTPSTGSIEQELDKNTKILKLEAEITRLRSELAIANKY